MIPSSFRTLKPNKGIYFFNVVDRFLGVSDLSKVFLLLLIAELLDILAVVRSELLLLEVIELFTLL